MRITILCAKGCQFRDFVFYCPYLLCYKFHSINCKRVGSYTVALDWIKKRNNKSYQ